MTSPRTLWRSEALGSVFLLPDDLPIPAGSLELRAGARRRRSVDARSVAAYEVTPDEARRFLDARLDAFVAQATRTIASWPSPPASRDPAPAPGTGPGSKLFEALTGRTAASVDGDPAAFLGALGEVGGSVTQAAREGPKALETRLRALGDTLRAHGVPVPPAAPPDDPAA